MPLVPGTRIGVYEVTSAIGAGGMGEVYKARDTRLGRDVALKILPEGLAGDGDRLMRFEREARTLAALNHPHIAQVYGLEDAPASGQAASSHVLVMELVDGEDLSTRIARGPISLDEALPIARQIADALEAAHEAGIVHRDLKPANIKVRADGSVKVLDFGLAKVIASRGGRIGAGGSRDSGAGTVPANSATFTSPAMTAHGIILGTAAYMSPEQARGLAVDARADLWAFGCVLFEMLTGTRAFAGDTVTDLLAAVVKEEPRWNLLPGATPAALHRLLRRSLSKDRKRRLASAADAALDIEEALARDRTVVASVSLSRSKSRVLLPAVASVAVIASLAGAYVLGSRATMQISAPPAAIRFVIPAPSGTQIVTGHREVAISPDGRQVAFIARGAADQYIYVRRLDELTPRQITGTEGARDLTFSPDGRSIAFHAGNKIRRVSLAGGAPSILADAVHAHGLAWHPAEDAIYFAPHQASAIWKIPADGRSPAVAITTLDSARGELSHEWPVISADGATLVFTVNANTADLDQEGVSFVTLATSTRETLRAGGAALALSGDGELLIVRRRSAMAARYAGGRLSSPELLDAAAAIDVAAFSPGGTLAYVPSPDLNRRSLVWITPEGAASDAGFGQRDYWAVSLSPDGRRAAIALGDGPDAALYLADAGGGGLTMLTKPGTGSPAWSPDGKWLAGAIRQADANTETLARVAAEAGRTWSPLPASVSDDQYVAQWTPDGRSLLLSLRNRVTGRRSVAALTLDRPSPETSVVVDSVDDRIVQFASLSPDGRWLAYESNEGGRAEVYVQSYPSPAARAQVSRAGGSRPIWTKGGRELYFVAGSAIMSSTFTSQPEPRFSAPRVIVEDGLIVQSGAQSKPFDVAPDGRILAIKEDDSIRSDHIVIVQNWLGDVKARSADGPR